MKCYQDFYYDSMLGFLEFSSFLPGFVSGFYQETGVLGGPGEVLGGPRRVLAITTNCYEFIYLLGVSSSWAGSQDTGVEQRDLK